MARKALVSLIGVVFAGDLRAQAVLGMVIIFIPRGTASAPGKNGKVDK